MHTVMGDKVDMTNSHAVLLRLVEILVVDSHLLQHVSQPDACWGDRDMLLHTPFRVLTSSGYSTTCPLGRRDGACLPRRAVRATQSTHLRSPVAAALDGGDDAKSYPYVRVKGIAFRYLGVRTCVVERSSAAVQELGTACSCMCDKRVTHEG